MEIPHILFTNKNVWLVWSCCYNSYQVSFRKRIFSVFYYNLISKITIYLLSLKLFIFIIFCIRWLLCVPLKYTGKESIIELNIRLYFRKQHTIVCLFFLINNTKVAAFSISSLILHHSRLPLTLSLTSLLVGIKN